MNPTPSPSWRLITEFVICFIVLPVLYWLDWIPVHKIIPLLALFLYCLAILVAHKRINKTWFTWTNGWNMILIRFLLLGVLIVIFLYLCSGNPLFTDFSANRKLLYMVIMYPFLSAFPQELIFREFFFYRYASLIPKPSILLLANTMVFAFAHIYFANWIVIVFTTIGGLLFSLTYFKTKSLLTVTIEHTLYGLLILSTSLSAYFYKSF